MRKCTPSSSFLSISSFLPYRNFIYTWNDSLSGCFFLCFFFFFFFNNNSSNPHHILIKTFFRRISFVFYYTKASTPFFTVPGFNSNGKKNIIEKKIFFFSKYNSCYFFVFVPLFVFHLALIVFWSFFFCSSDIFWW